MSDNPITEYQEKLQEFNRACSALKSMVSIVRVWSNHFQNFNKVMTISDTSEETPARLANQNKKQF